MPYDALSEAIAQAGAQRFAGGLFSQQQANALKRYEDQLALNRLAQELSARAKESILERDFRTALEGRRLASEEARFRQTQESEAQERTERGQERQREKEGAMERIFLAHGLESQQKERGYEVEVLRRQAEELEKYAIQAEVIGNIEAADTYRAQAQAIRNKLGFGSSAPPSPQPPQSPPRAVPVEAGILSGVGKFLNKEVQMPMPSKTIGEILDYLPGVKYNPPQRRDLPIVEQLRRRGVPEEEIQRALRQ